MSAYQGHLPDGSSVQRHSAGSFYPYVLALRDSKDPSRRYDWGLMGPRIEDTIWLKTSDAWERAALQMLELG